MSSNHSDAGRSGIRSSDASEVFPPGASSTGDAHGESAQYRSALPITPDMSFDWEFEEPPPVYRGLMVARAAPEVPRTFGAMADIGHSSSHEAVSSISSIKAELPARQVLRVPAEPATPTPLPYPVLGHDEFSSVIVKSPLSLLVPLLSTMLTALSVDFTFKPSKCKWKGKYYSRHQELDLRVFVYHGNWTKDQWVVDFQRRKGCAMTFAQLCRDARARLIAAKIAVQENGDQVLAAAAEAASTTRPEGGPRIKGFCPPPLAPIAAEVPAAAPSASCYSSLVNMAMSGYADIQSQAVRDIAVLVEEDDGARAVLADVPGLIKHLVKCLGSKEPAIHRCAAAALRNFARDAGNHANVVREGAVDCLIRLCLDSQVEIEAKRQCAAFFANISEGDCGRSSLSNGENAAIAKKAFETLLATGDERIAGHVAAAQRQRRNCRSSMMTTPTTAAC